MDAALVLPDGAAPMESSPPALSEIDRDSLAGATAITPFQGIYDSQHLQDEDAGLVGQGTPGMALSTLNAELLLSGPSIVPFNSTMQILFMQTLSGLMEAFPHKAELKTAGVRTLSFSPDVGMGMM